jgi:hypothetical protein
MNDIVSKIEPQAAAKKRYSRRAAVMDNLWQKVQKEHSDILKRKGEIEKRKEQIELATQQRQQEENARVTSVSTVAMRCLREWQEKRGINVL